MLVTSQNLAKTASRQNGPSKVKMVLVFTSDTSSFNIGMYHIVLIWLLTYYACIWSSDVLCGMWHP